MSFKLYTSRKDTVRFISSIDQCVQCETDDEVEAYAEYLRDLDPSRLTLTGDPVVFILRPLSWAAYELACRDAKGIAVKDLYTDEPTARELLRLSCEDVENWPIEWGDEKAKRGAFRFEYRRKVLAPEFAEDLPGAVCREAAKVLLDTLPINEPDQVDEDGNAPFAKGDSGESSGS